MRYPLPVPGTVTHSITLCAVTNVQLLIEYDNPYRTYDTYDRGNAGPKLLPVTRMISPPSVDIINRPLVPFDTLVNVPLTNIDTIDSDVMLGTLKKHNTNINDIVKQQQLQQRHLP